MAAAGDLETPIADPSPLDGHDRSKKPAWTRIANGSGDVGTVMGDAWPALSESSKATSKGAGPDSTKSVSDSVIIASKVEDNVSSPKADFSNLGSLNHAPPARQKSMKHSGSGANNGNASGSVGNCGDVASAAGAGAIGPPPLVAQEQQAVPQMSLQGKNYGNWERGPRGAGSGSQLHANSDHHRGHGGNRRGNNGGGGAHHNNYNNNRDQERGSYDNYHHRGHGGREAHMQHWGSRTYIRPPQTAQISSPFISPVSMVRPFGNPLVYPDVPSPVIFVAPQPHTEPFAGFPFMSYPPAPPAFFLTHTDSQRDTLLKQIEYYFSNENLCKDTYLRQHMDEHGWVSASVIAGFNRVKALTESISFILETVKSSALVEVQGEKMRRRKDWSNWVLPQSNSPTAAVSGLQTVATPDYVNLADSLQSVGLGTSGIESTVRVPTHREVVYSRSGSGNLSKQFQVVGHLSRDGNVQVTGHVNTDETKAAKSLSRTDSL